MADKRIFDTVGEQSSAQINVAPIGPDGAALVLDVMTWTLSKLDGTIVNSREDVAVSSPTASENILLQGDDLAILDGQNKEERVFTIEGTYTFDFGRGDVSGVSFNDQVFFTVKARVVLS